MECKKENIKALAFPETTSAESSVEGEVILPDYCPNIMRVVRTKARPYIVSKTSRSERYCIEGYVEFSVLYTSEEDGSLKSVMHALPFSHTFETDVNETTFTHLTATVTSVNTRALSPQKLYLRAVLQLNLLISCEIQAEIATSDGAPKGVWMKKEDAIESCAVVCKGQKPVKVSDEISLAPKKCDKILGYDATFVQTDKKLLTGKMITKADMTLKILYSDAETGLPATVERTVPVSQAVDIETANENTTCSVEYSLRDCKIEVLESGDGATDIAYEAEVCAEVQGLKTSIVEYCSDAFSETDELKIACADITTAKCYQVNCCGTARETIQTGYYDKIFSISIDPVITSETLNTDYGCLTVEGEFVCDIILTDAEKDFRCIEKSLPFSFTVTLPGCSGNVKSAAEICVKNFAFVENDAQSIEVRVDYCYDGIVFCSCTCNMLTGVESSGARSTDDRSEMVLYFAEKDESVWGIAKKYAVSPDKICSVNNIDGAIKDKTTLLI